MRLVFFIIFWSVSHLACGQLFDSISEAFTHKPKPVFGLETRNAFITNSLVKVRGAKIGLSFNSTVKVGLTYNWIKDDVYSIPNDSAQVRLNFIAPFFEYVFFQNERFIFSIPIKLGIGNAFYKNDLGQKFFKRSIIVYEPAMLAEVRFLRYFAVGGGVGYRVMLKGNPLMDEQLTSPLYIFGFKIYFDEVKKTLGY